MAALARMAEAGLTTFDCADIYTGVEELLEDYPDDPDVLQMALTAFLHTNDLEKFNESLETQA